MAVPAKVKAIMEREGLSGVNKPKRTPKHPTKSHVVMASEGGRYKLIRFGQQGVKTNQTAGQEKPLSLDTRRTSRRVSYLLLIGLIRSSGVPLKLNQALRSG